MPKTTTKTITDIRQLPFINKTNWDITPTFNPQKDYKIGEQYAHQTILYLKNYSSPMVICSFLSAFPKKEKWTSIEHGFIQSIEKALNKDTIFSTQDDMIIKKKLIQIQETEESKMTESLYDIILYPKKKADQKKKLDMVKFQDYEMTIHDANGARWIPSKEVGAALGTTRIRGLVKDLIQKSELIENKHFCTLTVRKSEKGNPNITALSHRGIIRVAMRSEGKRAKDFRDWAEDVLFEVMVTGKYEGKPKHSAIGQRLSNIEIHAQNSTAATQTDLKWIRQNIESIQENQNCIADNMQKLAKEIVKLKEQPAEEQNPEAKIKKVPLGALKKDKITKQVWDYFMGKADHKSGWFTLKRWGGRRKVYLKRGEFVFGLHSFADNIGISRTALRNRLDKLIKAGKITKKHVSNYSLIKVVGVN